jgi:ligand-binding SRPBCC domain-containing protein
MPKIELETEIHSTLEICFDLSRSIDLHKLSTSQTKEEAIAGKTSGLIGPGEWVTWRATHLGIRQELSSKITAFERPHFFVDEQAKGIFKSFSHLHEFEQKGKWVIMRDVFEFESPFGLLGQIFNFIYLNKYMRKLLETRNQVIKDFAETEKWKGVL